MSEYKNEQLYGWEFIDNGDKLFKNGSSANDTIDDKIKSVIKKWLSEKKYRFSNMDGLIVSKKTNSKRPALLKIIKHLEQLTGNERRLAVEYIRHAPRQIDTEYRRQIENIFFRTF